MSIVRLIAVILSVSLLGRAGAAQGVPQTQGDDPLALALVAYGDLEFDEAAAELRTLLSPESPTQLTTQNRIRAFMYLGAADYFRGVRDSAAASFASLLNIDPRYRPDELIFPPEVSTLFHETRLGVQAVAVELSDGVEVEGPGDRYPVRIYSTSLHDIRVQVFDRSGEIVRQIYDGAIGDSLQLLWDARYPSGDLVADGDYRLRVVSRSPQGLEVRTVEGTLHVLSMQRDTSATPVFDMDELRSEVRAPGSALRPTLLALGLAGLSAALPSMTGSNSDGMGARFAVTGAIGVAGLTGFLIRSRPVPVPENVLFNQRLRERHESEVERIGTENEQIRLARRIRIEHGAVNVVGTP